MGKKKSAEDVLFSDSAMEAMRGIDCDLTGYISSRSDWAEYGSHAVCTGILMSTMRIVSELSPSKEETEHLLECIVDCVYEHKDAGKGGLM